MRYLIIVISIFALMGCNQKKTDIELFEDSPIRINLSADTIKGYEPLFVSFSAYLETEESSVFREINEVKWIIRGPRDYYREIIEESFNYQDTEENKENAFYLEYDFSHHGTYKVKLVLNQGEYSSRSKAITVLEDNRNRPRRGLF